MDLVKSPFGQALLIILLLIALSFLLPGRALARSSRGVAIGTEAPDFTLQDASGKWVSLSDYRGKKVFLFIWSSWCRCKYQLESIQSFYKDYKSDDFEIVAVANDSQGFKWAGQYLKRAGATFVTLLDPNNELGKKYNYWATENGFLIDEGGVVRMSTIGFNINNVAQHDELVKLMKTDFKPASAKPVTRTIAERIKAAQELLAANPRDIGAMLELAELYRRSGDLTTAEAVLRNAIKGKWTSADAHFRLGVILYQQGKEDLGAKEWKKARKLAPMNYIYMRNMQAYYKPHKFYEDIMAGAHGRPCKKCK